MSMNANIEIEMQKLEIIQLFAVCFNQLPPDVST